MENPELYSSANGMQKKDAKDILAEFRDKIKWTSGAKVLDVGCGSGEVTTDILLPVLPKDFTELTGLDISLEMIQHARNLHCHPKLSFIQFDIAQNYESLPDQLQKTTFLLKGDKNLNPKEEACKSKDSRITMNIQKGSNCSTVQFENFKPTGYDVIYSFYCLHWVTNQRLALKNIFKLLKPGGEALLVFLAKSPIFTLYRKLSALELWKDYMKDVDNFIPFYQDSENPLENFMEIIKSSGFVVLQSECRDRNYVFHDLLSLKSAITAVSPFLSRIPNNLHEEFIKECLHQTKILNLTEYKNNCYQVSYKLIVAHIQKPV